MITFHLTYVPNILYNSMPDVFFSTLKIQYTNGPHNLVASYLLLSPQEIFSPPESRAAEEAKASWGWRKACGLGSSQYGRYFPFHRHSRPKPIQK